MRKTITSRLSYNENNCSKTNLHMHSIFCISQPKVYGKCDAE